MNSIRIFNLISFFGGFLSSSIVDTTLGEFNEWAIVGAALVIATIESFNTFYYYILGQAREGVIEKPYLLSLMNSLNYLKIGCIYGLIVDAFKLGS